MGDTGLGDETRFGSLGAASICEALNKSLPSPQNRISGPDDPLAFPVFVNTPV